MTAPPRTVGILDTNVVILFPGIAAANALPDDALITTITLAELSMGPFAAGTEEERARRQARLAAASRRRNREMAVWREAAKMRASMFARRHP